MTATAPGSRDPGAAPSATRGAVDHAPRARRAPTPRLLLALAFLIAFLAIPFDLGLQDVVNVNEAQRLLPPAEMQVRHDWVVPYFDGDLYLAKPPLVYWLIGAAYTVAGSASPLAGRIAVALVCALVALAVGRIARRHGDARLGAWAAIILLSAYFFRNRAQEAEIDPVLTGAVLGMVYGQWRAFVAPRWLAAALIAGAFGGAAWLLKGPVTVPWLVASTAGAAVAARPGWRRGTLATAVITLVGLALFAPWAALLLHRVGFAPLWATLRAESLDRVAHATAINSGPIYFYVLQLGAGFLPWSWLLFFWARRDVRAWARAHTDDFFRAAAAFTVVAFVLFSLLRGKEPKYVLPLYPFLALLAAPVLAWLIAANDRVAQRAAAIGLGFWALVALLSPAAMLSELGPWLALPSAGGALLVLAAIVGALALVRLVRGRRVAWGAPAVALAVTLTVVGVEHARKLRENDIRSPRALAAGVRALAGRGVPVYRYGVGRPATVYLFGLAPKMPPASPAAVLPHPWPDTFAIATARDTADVRAALGAPTTVVRRDSSASGRYVLLILRPAGRDTTVPASPRSPGR